MHLFQISPDNTSFFNNIYKKEKKDNRKIITSMKDLQKKPPVKLI